MLNQSKLYLVTINLGGWVHDRIRILTRRKSDYNKGYDYWDRSGNYGFMSGGFDSLKLGANKDDGRWQFLFDNEKDAKLFLSGAVAAKQFMFETWA